MTDGTRALLALIMDTDTYVGLLTAPGVEMTGAGYARQGVASGQWVEDGSGITGPMVAFTGFVSDAPAIGAFVSTSAAGPILFPFPFASGIPRSLFAETDVLNVTPALALEDVTTWP